MIRLKPNVYILSTFLFLKRVFIAVKTEIKLIDIKILTSENVTFFDDTLEFTTT